jgi:hypothetical protein
VYFTIVRIDGAMALTAFGAPANSADLTPWLP